MDEPAAALQEKLDQRVRPLNPILQAMLRSQHGQRGVNHGASGTRGQQGAVLAAGPGTLADQRAHGAGLLRGSQHLTAVLLLVAMRNPAA